MTDREEFWWVNKNEPKKQNSKKQLTLPVSTDSIEEGKGREAKDLSVFLKWIREWVDIALGERSISGHGFFASFPQPYKKIISIENKDAVYYAICMIADFYKGDYETRDTSGSRWDFLMDETLKSQPWGMHKTDRTLQWNLWNALKMCKTEINNL